ncbi:MAG: DUF433 domain-containing protein [Candidatus Dormibacteria bacterium]
MAPANLRDPISIDPRVCGGKSCIRGHRIWVSLILGLLADGMSIEEILQGYPGLEAADVRASIAYPPSTHTPLPYGVAEPCTG